LSFAEPFCHNTTPLGSYLLIKSDFNASAMIIEAIGIALLADGQALFEGGAGTEGLAQSACAMAPYAFIAPVAPRSTRRSIPLCLEQHTCYINECSILLLHNIQYSKFQHVVSLHHEFSASNLRTQLHSRYIRSGPKRNIL
jgi:hypothetical protein